MTNKEAKELLRTTAWLGTDNGIHVYKAVEKAIEALECIDNIVDIVLDEENESSCSELVCRKLKKYGFLKCENGYYMEHEE